MTKPLFNEDAFRSDIVSVWGEHGAHADLFDWMVKRLRELDWFIHQMWDTDWSDDVGECIACGGALTLTDCPKHGQRSGCYGYLHHGEHEPDCPLAWLLKQPEWPKKVENVEHP